MLSSSVNQKPGSMTFRYDSLTSMPFSKSFSWLLSISVTLSCLPHLLTPKVACGWWLPVHNRKSSWKEADHAEIPKSWKASTEPRPKSIFPCLGHQPVRSKIRPACALISPKVLCLCLCFWKSRWRVQVDCERNGNVCRVSRKTLQKKCMAVSPTSNLSAWHIKLGSFTTFCKWHLDMLEDPNADSSHKKT